MNIETQQRMIGVIRNSFDISLTTIAELLGCDRRDVSDLVYKGRGSGLGGSKLLFIYIQAKRFAKMNYIRPDSMFVRPNFCNVIVKDQLCKNIPLHGFDLQQLKTIDTMEAEVRAAGQGGTPCRSMQEAIDETSTPYFGESYEG